MVKPADTRSNGTDSSSSYQKLKACEKISWALSDDCGILFDNFVTDMPD
jgi:hypothetical protein